MTLCLAAENLPTPIHVVVFVCLIHLPCNGVYYMVYCFCLSTLDEHLGSFYYWAVVYHAAVSIQV